MVGNPQVSAETQKIIKVKPEIETLTSKQIELKNSGDALKAKLNEKLNRNTEQLKTQQMSREEAVKQIETVKRNEPLITNALQTIEKETGGVLVGLENRFKSEESLTRKFTDRAQKDITKAEKRGKNADEIRNKTLQKISDKNNDALRYTYTFSPEKYVEGYNKTVKTLEKQGYKLESEPKNWWLDKGMKDDTGYRGINATFISPAGQKFEVQFHTPESFKFKNDTHYLYEEVRKPSVSEQRKQEIKQQNIRLAEPLEMPKDINKIGGKEN